MKDDLDWDLMPSLVSTVSNQWFKFACSLDWNYILQLLETYCPYLSIHWFYCKVFFSFQRHLWLLGHLVLECSNYIAILSPVTRVSNINHNITRVLKKMRPKWSISNFAYKVNNECGVVQLYSIVMQSSSVQDRAYVHEYWSCSSHSTNLGKQVFVWVATWIQ